MDNHEVKQCLYCGTDFTPKRKEQRYCSRGCGGKHSFEQSKSPPVEQEENNLEQPTTSNNLLDELDLALDSTPNTTGTAAPPEEDPLIVALNEATNEKTPKQEQVIIEQPDEDDEDFAPEPSTDNLLTNASIEESNQEDKVRFKLDSKDIAELIVSGYEMVINTALPKFYERTFFEPGDLSRLKLIADKAKQKGSGTIDISDDDLILMDKFSDYEKYLESLPLKPKERKNLLKPLEVMLKNNGKDLPPGWALAYAATVTTVPRLAPVILERFSKTFINPQ